MKMLLTAIVLAIATPAAAQTVADPHAGHTPAQHQAATAGHAAHGAQAMPGASMDHSKHEDCCPKGQDGKAMPCCEKMKAAGGKMECCQKVASAKGAADPHAGHDMSKQ
jgi:hypothetical protein